MKLNIKGLAFVGFAAAVFASAANAVTPHENEKNIVTSKYYVDSLVSTVEATAGGAVQDITEGTTNGTIAVDGTDVAVHGLGSAAYTASTAYDASGTAAGLVGTLSNLNTTDKTNVVAAINEVNTAVGNVDTGVMEVTEGATNGTIAVDGTDVAVHGLGSAAYTASTAYEAAGTVKNGTLTLTGSTTNTSTSFGANADSNASFTIRDLPTDPTGEGLTCDGTHPCALVNENGTLSWKRMAI